MLSGNIYITTDMNLATKLATDHKIICISGETNNYQQFINLTNTTVGAVLLPPYEASVAEINGDIAAFKQFYYAHLATNCMDFLAIIIRALFNGDNILIYLTADEMKMGYIKAFSEFMFNIFGIIIGTESNQCMFNPQYGDYILTVLLKYDLLNPAEFLVRLENVNVLDVDDSLIIKLKDLMNLWYY